MYTKFYNLKEKPFNLTPDPHFLYLGESHRDALDHLIYTVRERKGFMVMTGEVGTGKTTLIHALLRNLDENTKTVFIFNPLLGAKGFFKFVCIDLGIQAKDGTKAECLLQIYKFLIESYREGRNIVLIIDEAHDLTPSLLEEIRLFSNFETAKNKLIQIILVGQPELNVTLNLPQYRPLKQRISFWFYINPLNRNETNEYIRSRLYRAGIENSCFTEKAVEEIFRYSKGIPRVINILCENSLTIGCARDEKKIDEATIKNAIGKLEAYERRLPESVETPGPIDQARPFPLVTEVRETDIEGPEKREMDRLRLFAVILLISALVILGILMWYLDF